MECTKVILALKIFLISSDIKIYGQNTFRNSISYLLIVSSELQIGRNIVVHERQGNFFLRFLVTGLCLSRGRFLTRIHLHTFNFSSAFTFYTCILRLRTRVWDRNFFQPFAGIPSVYWLKKSISKTRYYSFKTCKRNKNQLGY